MYELTVLEKSLDNVIFGFLVYNNWKKNVLMDTGDREAFVFTTSLFLLEAYSSMWCFSDVSITSSWDSYCSQLLVYIQVKTEVLDHHFLPLNTLYLRTHVLSSFSLGSISEKNCSWYMENWPKTPLAVWTQISCSKHIPS